MGANNSCHFIGRLSRDPELRYTNSGKAVVSFGLAVTDHFRKDDTGKKGVTWLDCQAWGQTAEVVANYCAKGDLIGVSARFEINEWQAQDGTQKKTPRFTVEGVELLGSKNGNGGNGGGNTEPAANRPAPPAEAPAEFNDPFADE